MIQCGRKEVHLGINGVCFLFKCNLIPFSFIADQLDVIICIFWNLFLNIFEKRHINEQQFINKRCIYKQLSTGTAGSVVAKLTHNGLELFMNYATDYVSFATQQLSWCVEHTNDVNSE